MHIDVNYWLHSLNLSQYQSHFRDYHGVQDILNVDERFIRDRIGIHNSAHRAIIVSSLVVLRNKRNLRMRGQYGIQQPLTNSTSLSNLVWPQSRSGLEFAQSEHNKSPRRQFSASVLNISQMQDLEIDRVDLTEAESLRRQLEWELSLDGRCHESHAWFHGAIPRSHAETLLTQDGQFLIRESSSGQPGDLVLSTIWKGNHLHFIISKVVIQPHTVYESIQYRLEEEPFETIPDLVTCYVGSGKAVTAATGAKITTPVNRTQPLSLYASRFSGSPLRHPSSPGASQQQQHNTLYSGRNPLPAVSGRVRMAHPTIREYSTQSLPRPNSTATQRLMMRRGPSHPSLSDDGASPVSSSPPKPSRVPSQMFQPEDIIADENPRLNELDESATAGTDDDEAVDRVPQLPGTSTTLPRLRTPIKKRPISMTRNSFLDRRSVDLEAQAIQTNESDQPLTGRQSFDRPFPSLFDTNRFQTPLLPDMENKPLDMKALEEMSIVLDSHSAKSIALHLLHGDLNTLGGFPELEDVTFHYRSHYVDRGITSGIELCTLPQGEQLRLDLLERTHCLRLFVAVTILTCPTLEDRTAMLHLWIEVATESKTALGNMYGFAGLMYGLCMPQIQRLKATWNLLRQRHTSSAFTFETRLKPSHRSEVVPHAPNTTVPDLHSAILLWTATTVDSFRDEEGISLPFLHLQLPVTGPDFGLGLLADHMELIRSWSHNLPLYLRNSRKALEHFALDDLLADMFRTEFHLKFLWGSRGVSSDSQQRYSKFEQVLHVLSERCEPTCKVTEPVN